MAGCGVELGILAGFGRIVRRDGCFSRELFHGDVPRGDGDRVWGLNALDALTAASWILGAVFRQDYRIIGIYGILVVGTDRIMMDRMMGGRMGSLPWKERRGNR